MVLPRVFLLFSCFSLVLQYVYGFYYNMFFLGLYGFTKFSWFYKVLIYGFYNKFLGLHGLRTVNFGRVLLGVF